ncbi:hypothetical protein Leryth_027614 [Lithospermum erythrorhizon]|nr:hypothetical protein Leryth_027614 [Lithospermum erythrorhizon]
MFKSPTQTFFWQAFPLFHCHLLYLRHQYHGKWSVGAVKNESLVSESDMKPYIEPGKMVMMMMNESRRKLGSFHICSLCTCCGGGTCLPTPCCYAIVIKHTNKPQVVLTPQLVIV